LSTYYNAAAIKEMQAQTAGTFGGVGLELALAEGSVRVVAALDDTPAARAGILPGDLVTAIDGKPTTGLELAAVVARVRGEIGQPVFLTLKREGEAAPLEVRLVRAQIAVQSVKSRPENDVAYLRIATFNDTTPASLRDAVTKASPANPKGYVLDLRSNTGGALNRVIEAADLFLESGDILATHGRTPDSDASYKATPGEIAKGLPIAILVNEGTSSGAEIFVGALKDNGRAKVFGVRTYGKGSVQTIFTLGALGAVRLTTSRFYTPSGRNLEGHGIDPDVVVPGTASASGPDPVLAAALAYLRGLP
jgi:carboxyl-terminal processing protease